MEIQFLGIPVDNTIVYLLDKQFRPVTAGEQGEVFVAGLNVANGYVNGRDPTAFVPNPFSTDHAGNKSHFPIIKN
jgi:non-ribosomal peptide synthetase component F